MNRNTTGHRGLDDRGGILGWRQRLGPRVRSKSARKTNGGGSHRAWRAPAHRREAGRLERKEAALNHEERAMRRGNAGS